MADELEATASLTEAQTWLADRVEEGATCPCCTQYAKVYRRKINAGMARALIEQYKVSGRATVHTRRIWLPHSKEAAQLQWWGLIEHNTTRREDGGASGWWCVTEKGVQYLRNQLRVPKYALVYDGKIQGHDGTEMASVVDALGTRFSYQELMDGV